MRLYVAHNFAARERLRALIVPRLEAAGHVVTSRWITDDTNQMSPEWAQKDLADVRAADALLIYLDNAGDTPGRGKWVEMGYALALGLPVFAIGCDARNIFALHPSVVQIESIVEITPARALLGHTRMNFEEDEHGQCVNCGNLPHAGVCRRTKATSA